MGARSRLALLLAGLAAAAFLAWPGFSVDRDSDWRKILAGFQLQKESGDFIGATRALIHLHELDGRPGRVRFTLKPRVEGEGATVDVTGPLGGQKVVLDSKPVEVEVRFAAARDVEITLETPAAANPRPLLLSNLRVERDHAFRPLLLSFLPLVFGAAALLGLLSEMASVKRRTAAALLVVASATFFALVACDPVRALSFNGSTTQWIPMGLAVGFALVGLLGAGPRSAAIALVGVTLSLHVLTVHSGFVYDDRLWARPWNIAELASTFAGSEDPRGISGEQYRPIPSVTHAADHFLWGPSPFAFHGTNMGLQAFSAFLLLVLLTRLRLPRGPAFVGALVLAAHPMAASSVGWISERTDTLADIFILATLITFLGPKGRQTARVLGIALLALWSKETAVMLPLLAAMFALAALTREERKERVVSLRSLFALVVLYVAVWVSLFPEKAFGRLQKTAATLQSDQSGWGGLFGSLFSQLFRPIGFEAWRATRDSLPDWPWIGLAMAVSAASLGASLLDRTRTLSWRLIALGLAFSALIVLPFRGHDAVDIYRLGHSPTVGFAIAVAGLTALVAGEIPWRSMAVAALLLLRFGPMATATSAAWGYPGFQFRMALRFNLENPLFLSGLTPEMRRDLERESRFEAHRDDPLKTPFEP